MSWDATVQFRAVGPLAAAADELSDATVQFQVISQLADPITPFRVIGRPTYSPAHVNGDRGQAELRSLIHSILAGLRPREREVIELSFRHDLNDMIWPSRSAYHRAGRMTWPHAPEADWRKPSAHCTSRLPDERPAQCWGNCWPTGTGS